MQTNYINFSVDHTGQVTRSERMLHLSSRISYCDYNTHDSHECNKNVCVFYHCSGSIVEIILDLIHWLHKMTCRLLHERLFCKIQANYLPDILKDIRDPCKTMDIGPDVVPVLPRVCTNSNVPAKQLEAITTFNSNHEQSIQSHTYINTNHSHHCYSHQLNNSNNYNNIADSQNSSIDNFRLTQNGCNLIHDAHDHRSYGRTPIARVQSKGFEPTRKHHFNVSPEVFNQTCQDMRKIHRNIMVSNSTINRNLQLTRYTTKTQASDSQINNNTDYITLNLDLELTKDLVIALRNVGDNLNARMGCHNQQSVQAVFGATKISLGWLVHRTLKQRSAFGAIVGLSLELIHQFTRL